MDPDVASALRGAELGVAVSQEPALKSNTGCTSGVARCKGKTALKAARHRSGERARLACNFRRPGRKDVFGEHSEPRCGNVPLTRTPNTTRDDAYAPQSLQIAYHNVTPASIFRVNEKARKSRRGCHAQALRASVAGGSPSPKAVLPTVRVGAVVVGAPMHH